MLKRIHVATAAGAFLCAASLFCAGCTTSASSDDPISQPSTPASQQTEDNDSGNGTTEPQAPVTVDVTDAKINIVKSEGLLNSAYIIFEQIDGATYKVLCDDKQIDDALIRSYDTYTYYTASETDGQTTWTQHTLSNVVRADAPGLASGSHTLKVCALSGDTVSEYSSATMDVIDHDRTGFAFTGSANPGAYKADGTLKDNAIVIYVTGDTAKTVSYTAVKGKNATANATYTGLQDILSESSLKKLTVPIDIRIVGTITKSQMDSLGSSEEGLQIKTTTENGVTVEGIGHDAAVYGFGFLIRNASYVELCNLGVYNFMDDGISVDTDNSYLWIHNNDISYGAVGSDSDQEKGDGSLDFKKSYYSTLSYNHFWDSGKCNLLDASASSTEYSNYLSYHHNWYDHSDSRHPRIRNASAVHVYNNYYDGNAKYGVGITSGASAFVEGNYFRDAKAPMMSSLQGTDAQGSGTFSGEEGGTIKAWNNYIGDNSANSLHFITNKYDYTNNKELGETRTVTKSVGTENGDGTYTIYDAAVSDSDDGIADCAFITISNASKKGAYYQVAKKKTGFTLSVPANTTKVIVKAKCGSSNITKTEDMLKVNGTAVSMDLSANYTDYEVPVSVNADTTIEIANANTSYSLNVREIKVIAVSAWSTTYTTGADLSDIDAYEVESRDETIPDTVTTKAGSHTYSNFDTDSSISLGVTASQINEPEAAKANVIAWAGRHESDFAYTFDNSTDDTDYSVNTALKALVVGYASGLTSVQGATASGNSSSGEGGSDDSGDESGDSGDVSSDSGNGEGSTGTTGSSVIVVTFDSFTSGATVSGVTIKGNLKSDVSEKTYNDVTYTTALKMESSTSISFTTVAAATLTLITDSANKKIKIDDTKYTTDSDGVVSQALAAGSHSVVKGDGMNVYAIIITPAE